MFFVTRYDSVRVRVWTEWTRGFISRVDVVFRNESAESKGATRYLLKLIWVVEAAFICFTWKDECTHTLNPRMQWEHVK